MKTKAIATSAIIALLLAGVVAATYARSQLGLPGLKANPSDSGSDAGDDQTRTTSQHEGDGGGSGDDDDQQKTANSTLFIGQSFVFSNLTGTFANLTNEDDGAARGSLTLIVTGIFRDGVTLSIASGHFTLANSTFTITGGSIVVNRDSESGIGSGKVGSSGFIILFHDVKLLSTHPTADSIRLDFKNGTSEFLVSLNSQQAGEDSSGDSGDSGDE